jgi:hypothetical protein
MDPTLDAGFLFEIVTQREHRFRRQATEHARSARRKPPPEPTGGSARR